MKSLRLKEQKVGRQSCPLLIHLTHVNHFNLKDQTATLIYPARLQLKQSNVLHAQGVHTQL